MLKNQLCYVRLTYFAGLGFDRLELMFADGKHTFCNLILN